jgi:N6-L-threonylcarbamoyladenine synthase
MALLVSGGHTNIIDVVDYSDYKVIGKTRDDAIGEAYDKVARTLGLPYPGGPQIDKLAKIGNENAIPFTKPYIGKDSYEFSFSGIKSGVLSYINSMNMKGIEINKSDVAASFQNAVLTVLIDKLVMAAKVYGRKKIVLAGGVASNSRLRERLESIEGFEFLYPPLDLCTDNGAMIGAAAYHKYLKGEFSTLELNGVPNLKI